MFAYMPLQCELAGVSCFLVRGVGEEGKGFELQVSLAIHRNEGVTDEHYKEFSIGTSTFNGIFFLKSTCPFFLDSKSAEVGTLKVM